MMIEKIKADLKEAMKLKDALKMSVLRMVLSVANSKNIELSDTDVLEIISKEAKKRKEAISLFLEGGREDLASKEEAELKIIGAYLPEQMSESEIKKVIARIILGTPSKEFGLVMKEVMKELKGKADASLITKILKEELK
mgnify:FL=1